jgi:hypothetical protein
MKFVIDAGFLLDGYRMFACEDGVCSHGGKRFDTREDAQKEADRLQCISPVLGSGSGRLVVEAVNE